MENEKKQQEAKTVTFEMTAAEAAAADAFCQEHNKHALKMSAGEAYQFIFTPTMLGDCVAVRCLTCGKIQDITDIEKF